MVFLGTAAMLTALRFGAFLAVLMLLAKVLTETFGDHGVIGLAAIFRASPI